ncbi:MAG: class I SAM-dependent methyltransferase [Myxococcales bacterium]|nr:class I SAM-dependent methyltransferase [Myxococcales bacterium]MDD9971149.1 class I SAM-dependent methyltransferase [Myxococcales bacterium]
MNKKKSGLTMLQLIERRLPPLPWVEGDNIPWDEPGFSRRMLEEHLSQAHDLASRREPVIEAHVDFIRRQLRHRQADGQVDGQAARVLDLGCGPGLYLHRLARLGFQCRGIDFSPAAIGHGREVAASEQLECSFEQADLREADFGEGYEGVLLLFGQINVFERERAQDILRRARAALVPGGKLVLEAQELEAVRGEARTTTDWRAMQAGLFSSTPHLLLHERFWDEPSLTATERWYVVDAETAVVQRHAASTCGYTGDGLRRLLTTVGFGKVDLYPSLTGEAEAASPGLFVLVASR